MIDEMKKSISSTLYERTTSPFYGAFIFSWLIWNWNLVYFMFFISEKSLNNNKLEHINTHLINYWKLIPLPLISTLFFTLLLPYLTNRIYSVHLKYKKWRNDEKIKIELKQVLTLEQSIELRQEILKLEEEFKKIIDRKNAEIEQLKFVVSEGNKMNIDDEIISKQKSLLEIAEIIKTTPYYLDDYYRILKNIQGGFAFQGHDPKLVSLLEANGIISKSKNGIYDFTKLGLEFQRIIDL
jgi:hypothetical protein